MRLEFKNTDINIVKVKDNLNKFEIDAITKILKEDEANTQYLNQLNHVASTQSVFTGSGFYTSIKFNSQVTKANKTAKLHNINATVVDYSYQLGFRLIIKDGLINELECYSWGEGFPKEIKQYTFVEIDLKAISIP